MAQRLLKPKSGRARAAAEARVNASSGGIVVAGTYRVKQLVWIEKNGVYNYPVKDGDEFTPESFGKIGELWLCADAKATRHVFTSEFDVNNEGGMKWRQSA